jgi:hypothetical protein
VEPDSANIKVGLSLNAREFQGKPIRAAAEVVRFLSLWSEPNWVAFHGEYDPPPTRAQEAIQGQSPLPAWWQPTLQALDMISVHSRKAMRSPNVGRMTEENSRYLRYIGGLLDGAPLAIYGTEMVALIDQGALAEELEAGVRQLRSRFPLEFAIDDMLYEIEPAEVIIDNARYELTEDQDGAEPDTVKCRVRQFDADGQVKDEVFGTLTWPARNEDPTQLRLGENAPRP